MNRQERFQRLQADLQDLDDQEAALLAEGEYIPYARIVFTPAGGTASRKAKEECKYAMLRAWDGHEFANGKKNRYIRLKDIGHYQAAVERGKQWQKLQTKKRAVQKKIDELLAKNIQT